jgi:dienelactone hydrolase
LLERVKAGIADVGKSFMIDTWLARQTPEKVLPILHKVIEAAKDEFADAIANGGGIYAVGYCVGARYLLLLGGEHEDHNATQAKDDEEEQAVPPPKGPYIKVGAIAHAAQVTPKDLASLKIPTLMICVENDPLFPAEVRQDGVETLEKGGIEHEVKVYPEVPHGFAVVGEYADPQIKEAQQQAYSQMLGWLHSH